MALIKPEQGLLIPRRKVLAGLTVCTAMGGPGAGAQTRGSGVPPAAPAAAAAVGYRKLAFYDDFDSISTIDLKDTRAPGFNWYVHNAWPSSIQTNWAILQPTPPGPIQSVANSLLTMGGPNFNTQNGSMLMSACANPSDSTKYLGNVFTNGFYAECRMSCLRPSNQRWPAFWTEGVEGHLTPSAKLGSEIDMMERNTNATVGVVNFNVYRIYLPGSMPIQNNNGQASTALDAETLSDLNIYGFRHVPMAQNGGTGLCDFYFNNVHLAGQRVTYTANGPATPGTTGPNLNGMFSELDSQHFFMILNSGDESRSIQVDWVRVWQL